MDLQPKCASAAPPKPNTYSPTTSLDEVWSDLSIPRLISIKNLYSATVQPVSYIKDVFLSLVLPQHESSDSAIDSHAHTHTYIYIYIYLCLFILHYVYRNVNTSIKYFVCFPNILCGLAAGSLSLQWCRLS